MLDLTPPVREGRVIFLSSSLSGRLSDRVKPPRLLTRTLFRLLLNYSAGIKYSEGWPAGKAPLRPKLTPNHTACVQKKLELDSCSLL